MQGQLPLNWGQFVSNWRHSAICGFPQIERGLSSFIEVGNALAEIRDGRLYGVEYDTFEEYCQGKWQLSRRHVDRLVASSQIVANLRPIGLKLPATETQARPLTNLSPKQQTEVWQAAVSTAPNGKVTAAHVQQVATAFQSRLNLSQNDGRGSLSFASPLLPIARNSSTSRSAAAARASAAINLSVRASSRVS